MFRDAVCRNSELMAGCEIFYGVLARIAFLLSNGDNVRDFHLVGSADLIANLLAREIDGDGDIFSAEILCQFSRMWHRRFIDDAEHELRRRRICRKEIVRRKEVPRDRISHRETDGGDSLAAEKVRLS